MIRLAISPRKMALSILSSGERPMWGSRLRSRIVSARFTLNSFTCPKATLLPTYRIASSLEWTVAASLKLGSSSARILGSRLTMSATCLSVSTPRALMRTT